MQGPQLLLTSCQLVSQRLQASPSQAQHAARRGPAGSAQSHSSPRYQVLPPARMPHCLVQLVQCAHHCLLQVYRTMVRRAGLAAQRLTVWPAGSSTGRPGCL